jgi:2,3-bisphosphoglycerate-dependent phosphoglycerate mutase
MVDLFMIRHGLSTYNLENRFTGSTDVPLCETGVQQAKAAAEKLKNYKIDIAYTSLLKRAIDTLKIILEKNHHKNIVVVKNKALNERDYGELQGLNKAEVAKQYGDEQVHLWRRGYKTKPPGGESLEDTYHRVIPYFNAAILPDLEKGLNVLIVAHGNSLRAIFKDLDQISDDEIVNLDIDTGKIYRYQFDENLKIISRHIL